MSHVWTEIQETWLHRASLSTPLKCTTFFQFFEVLWRCQESLEQKWSVNSAILQTVSNENTLLSCLQSLDVKIKKVFLQCLKPLFTKIQRYCCTATGYTEAQQEPICSLQWLWVFHFWLCICIMELWAQPCYVFSGPLGRPLLDCN